MASFGHKAWRQLVCSRSATQWRSLTTQAAAPSQSLRFYYNRLFVTSGFMFRYIPSLLVRPQYDRLKDEIQASIGAENGSIVDVIPRPAEGGAFVTIDAINPDRVRELANQGLNRRYLLVNHRSQGFEVLGEPWITDIPRSISRVVKVSPTLPDEDCYELLRPYGRILRIDDGDVMFSSMQDAITASYCAHRTTPPFSDTMVRLSLLRYTSIYARARQWLTGHPRIVIPLIFAILFAVAYAIFEPVREFSVGAKIKGTLANVAKYVEWARASSQKLIIWGGSNDEEEGLLESNKLMENAKQLKTYIDEGSPTFTVVVGPKGSGKGEALDLALGEDKYVLDVDCDRLRGVSDDVMIRNLAHSVGYWPLFLWTNSIFKAAEVGIQGMTGQTTGITETTDQQVRRILTTASKAVRKIALRNANTAKESAYLESHPDQLPVVVLRGFSGADRTGEIIAEWAGELVKLQIARVVVIAHDAYSYDKTLGTALPNRVFRVVRIEDAAPDAAKEHVLRLFAKLATTEEANTAVSQFAQLGPDFLEPLGGRFTDLQSFGRRLLNGESPERALDNLIHSAALEVSQLFLNEGSTENWTVEQSWELVKLLAQRSSAEAWLSIPGTLAKNQIIQSCNYSALDALESSGMITLRRVAGRVTGVKASRPLFRAAFRELVEDPLVSNIMSARAAQAYMKISTDKIESAEGELLKLAKVANSRETRERQDYVAKQLAEAQSKLVQYQDVYLSAVNVLQSFKWYDPSGSTSNNSWFSNDKLQSKFD